MEGDDELAMLVGTLVKTAQTLLKNQRGEFFPFAAFVHNAGQVEMLGADKRDAQPKSTDMIEFLRGALQAMATQGRIKGSGICVNVSARLPGIKIRWTRSAALLNVFRSSRSIFTCHFARGFSASNTTSPLCFLGRLGCSPRRAAPHS